MAKTSSQDVINRVNGWTRSAYGKYERLSNVNPFFGFGQQGFTMDWLEEKGAFLKGTGNGSPEGAISSLLGLGEDELVSLMSGSNIEKGDLVRMILNAYLTRAMFDYSNGAARVNALMAMGMSRQAALAALGNGAIDSTPLDTQGQSLAQQANIAGLDRQVAQQEANTNLLNAMTNADAAYWSTYESRFLEEGRKLLEPIAGAVYAWILQHEGDPNYVVPDWAKRSPEKFKRWMLQTEEYIGEDGKVHKRYLRPDAEQLIKSDAWDKMAHSIAGIHAFREEFAANIEGRSPREMEWDAHHQRLQRNAEYVMTQCNAIMAQQQAFQSAIQQYVQEFNSGLHMQVDGDMGVSIVQASTDSPWYEIFYNEDGTLRNDLPTLLSGLNADLQTRMEDCREYDKFNDEQWQALRNDAELRKNYAALYALMYGDMKSVYEDISQRNPQLAGELFKTQMLYQQIFGSMQNNDVFTGSFSAHTNRIAADAAARNAVTNEHALTEQSEHNMQTEWIDIYNAETQRLQGTSWKVGPLTIPNSGFDADGNTIVGGGLEIESDGHINRQNRTPRLSGRGQD